MADAGRRRAAPRRVGGGGGLLPDGYAGGEPGAPAPPADGGASGTQDPRSDAGAADPGSSRGAYADPAGPADAVHHDGSPDVGYHGAADGDASHGDAGYGDAGYGDAGYGYAGAEGGAGAGYDQGSTAYDEYDHGRAAYDEHGFDEYGFDQYGFDAYGFDRYGFDVEGYDADGYHRDDQELGEGAYEDDYEEYWAEEGAGSRGRRGRHPVLAGAMLLVLAVVVLAGAGILWASRQVNPGGHPGPKVLVTIPAGASSAQIGGDLAKAGVIHGGSFFRYYVKIQGDGPLLSGQYLLARNESYDQVISTLTAGPVVITDRLVIPEGFTLRQIAQRVARLPGMQLSAAKFLALSSSGSVRSPLEPSGVNDLEGLVYPATYTIHRTDSESTILEEMVGYFNQHMQSMGLAAGAARLHMTPYQVITVGSIIQGEAKFANQFADVASVIYNRLSAGTTLGVDSTLVYALRLANPHLTIAKVDYEQPSPYNTRLNKGLPPTPIDNPSLLALGAAINPAHTDLQYFVEVRQDGTLGFATTSDQFAQLRATCQANHLCGG